MYNCLILGSGRSGTSTAAGILAESGYDPGDDLLEAHEGNPKGFFESDRVNVLNDRIIAHLQGGLSLLRGKPGSSERALYWLHGSDHLSASSPFATALLGFRCKGEMRRILAGLKRPYCMKDPRFSYTLKAWRPFLDSETRFIVTFRHPAATARSVARFYGKPDDPELLRIGMNHFVTSYRHILNTHRHEGHWLFIHYSQLLDGSAVSEMGSFLGAELKGDFVEPKLNRSTESECENGEAMELYETLCSLSNAAGEFL